MKEPTILSIHYLPCLSWFRHLLNSQHVVLDQYEHFIKQTYRNRCVILSANGPLALTIPVKKPGHKQPMYTVEIEQDFNWQKQHWEALRSAYNSSPYFEHYEHHFAPFYHQQYRFLQEFNLGLIRLCLQLMKVEKDFVLSDQYIELPDNNLDLREVIHPKKGSEETFKPYLQVFAGKFPFQPNLSIVDLLFNHGPRGMKI